MICWSCQKKVPEQADFCPHCEAPVEPAPSIDEISAVAGALANMGPEVMDQLREAFEHSGSGEEFVNRVMVGNCPKCGSEKTGDCENDPDIDDLCIGRCFECGQLWCLDCEELFPDAPSTQHDCPFWEEMEEEMRHLDDLD